MFSEFAIALPVVRAAARAHGYAVGLHGSTKRDLDLIAVPWIELPSQAMYLVEAVRAAVDGAIYADGIPFLKPHGRRAWVIYFGERGRYIDLSVFPLADDPILNAAVRSADHGAIP